MCSRGNLNHLLAAHKALSEDATRFMISALAHSLDFFHRQGIVYRDLKPENVLIRSNGYPCLTDFGLQRLFKLKEKCDEGKGADCFAGSLEYVAPEVSGRVAQNAASDWWSLGVLR